MKKAILLVLAISALATSAFASEQSLQGGASAVATAFTCYAVGPLNEQYYWTHPNLYVARNNVIAACVSASGGPCYLTGCVVY